MATNRLVQREKVGVYADTMFKAANDAGGQDAVLEVRNQASQVMHLMNADMDLNIALSNADYSPAERHDMAFAIFADCNMAFREVMAVMAENGDAAELPRVFREYTQKMEQELGICVVDVVTAIPLDDALREQIKSKAKVDLGLDAMLNESVDKSILGGIIMSVNGMRIDASMISQLNRARNTLKNTDGGES